MIINNLFWKQIKGDIYYCAEKDRYAVIKNEIVFVGYLDECERFS